MSSVLKLTSATLLAASFALIGISSSAAEDDPVRALVVRLQGFDGSFQPELALNIADDGSVRLRNMRAETWIDADLKIKPRRWTQIRLLANRRTETYTVSIHTPGEAEQHGSTAAPLTPQPNLRSIVILPQPPQKSAVLIDEIALKEVQ